MALQLEPRFLLDDEWSQVGSLERLGDPLGKAMGGGAPSDDWDASADDGDAYDGETFGGRAQEPDLVEWIRAVRIEVAERADTALLKEEGGDEYLKAELGMNVIVPRGRIDELRYAVTLTGGEAGDIYALDGAPSAKVNYSHAVSGKATVGITKAFELVGLGIGTAAAGPAGGVLGRAAGSAADELLDIELNPFEFALGEMRKVEVAFSGGKTHRPEWYFRGGNVSDVARLAVTIRKPREVAAVTAEVRAAWRYDPGWRSQVKVGSDARTVEIYARGG